MDILHDTSANTNAKSPEDRFAAVHSLGLHALYFGLIANIVAGNAVDRVKEVLHRRSSVSAPLPNNELPVPRQAPRSF